MTNRIMELADAYADSEASTDPRYITESARAALQAEVERVTKELEAAKADAARYRWLRSLEHCNEAWCFIGGGNADSNLDAAIDAAMKGQPT